MVNTNHLVLGAVVAILLCLVMWRRRCAASTPSRSTPEAYADPTRAQRGDHGASRRRVSDTERTKLFNSGGRKGYV